MKNIELKVQIPDKIILKQLRDTNITQEYYIDRLIENSVRELIMLIKDTCDEYNIDYYEDTDYILCPVPTSKKIIDLINNHDLDEGSIIQTTKDVIAEKIQNYFDEID